MVKYVNGFSCIVNNESKQLLMNFVQNFPKISEDGFDSSNIVSESVATIAMDLELVEKMYQALKSIFEGNNEVE